MIIELKKFGTTLTSRQTGKESFLAVLPLLKEKNSQKRIEVDFSGIISLSPSWADEFLVIGLLAKLGNKLVLRKSDNTSVKATLNILEKTNNIKFDII